MLKGKFAPLMAVACLSGTLAFGQQDRDRDGVPRAADQNRGPGAVQDQDRDGIPRPADPGRGVQDRDADAIPRAADPNRGVPNARTLPARPVPGVDVRDSSEVVQHGGDLQSHIANCLILGNEEEIALSKFALEKAQNPQVKEFAQKMVDEHTQLNQKLQKFASEQSISLTGTTHATARQTTTTTAPAERDADRANPNRDQQNLADDAARNERTPARAGQSPDRAGRSVADRDPTAADAAQPRESTTTTRTEYTSVRGGASSDQLFQLAKEAAEHCLQMTKQELSQHQGEEFDMGYMGTQMGMHIQMLAKLKAAEGHVSGELQQVLQEAQQHTMQHKQEAEQIKQQLKAGSESGQSSRTQNRD
jgi:predicted outer membrane protein